MPRAIHRTLVSTAIGLSLTCGGAVFTGQVGAQPASSAGEEGRYSGGSGSQAVQEKMHEARMKDIAGGTSAGEAPATVAVQRTDLQDVQDENLGGGFYKDGYKADDWFYDFYESSVVRTDTQMSERPAPRSADVVRVAEQDRLADASQSKNSPFYTRRRQAQEGLFGRYYDDPWFYQQQDPAYAMPMTVAQSNSNRPAARDEEMLKGRVEDVKQVRNRTRGGQNTVALVKTSDGRSVIADLGPTQPLLGLALIKGDEIKASGHRENIGPYAVLMAHQVKSGANRVNQNRGAAWSGRDYRQVNGRIEQFRDIRVRETGVTHRAASVRMDDGRLALVDFGPSTANKIPANAAAGDRVTASGSIAQVGNYPVLFADRISMKDSTPVQIARPASEYAEPSARPFEASQQERSR
jgi:hypothetical protein